MPPKSASTRSKRARPESNSAESSPATSHKKRRVDTADGGSPLTAAFVPPNSSRSTLSRPSRSVRETAGSPAVGSAARKGRQQQANEVPDSEEEEDGGTAKSAHGKGASAKAAKPLEASVYDVPDSEDELAPTQTASARKPAKPRKGSRTVPAPRIAVPRVVVEPSDTEEATTENENNHTPTKPPTVARKAAALSASKEASTRGKQETKIGSVSRRLASTKSKKMLDPKTATNGGTELKGILTPSKRGRQPGVRKSVAFGSPAEDVFFEDLPSTTKKQTPAPSKATGNVKSAKQPKTKAKNAKAEPEVGEEVEEGEGRDDDALCVICSLPDSEAPNEMLFCDNCDKGYHQECYNIPVIPEGDWICRECSGESVAEDDVVENPPLTPAKKSVPRVKKSTIPDIANFGDHLQAVQRVLLDRCTGQRRIKLCGQDEAYEKAFQLVEQTVLAGEGNSMLVIGARGCGKTCLIESIISELSEGHKDDFHVVRLNGFIHTDDKIALKEIWRQLGKEMEVEDDLINKTNNYADTLASLLAVLSHPSEIAGAESGVTSKSVVFVMDEFDLFATHPRQTLLYNLFDIAQARKAPIAVVGLTSKIDVVESLEKRVKSRFSHRYVFMSLPKSVAAYWEICKQALTVASEDLRIDDGLSVPATGRKQFVDWWNGEVEALRQEAAFQDHLEHHFYSSKSVSAFYNTCIMPLSLISPESPWLTVPTAGDELALEAPDSKLVLLESLSDLDLALLIAAARLDIVAHTDTVNFAMAYDEYTSLMGRQRVMSATSGMLALGGGARTWGRGVAAIAWERLISVGLLTPATGGGRASAGNMGLEAKMWKMDVALEEIPVALKPSSILARWCREI